MKTIFALPLASLSLSGLCVCLSLYMCIWPCVYYVGGNELKIIKTNQSSFNIIQQIYLLIWTVPWIWNDLTNWPFKFDRTQQKKTVSSFLILWSFCFLKDWSQIYFCSTATANTQYIQSNYELWMKWIYGWSIVVWLRVAG